MFKRIYLIGGGLLIAGYLGATVSGWELLASRTDPVPKTYVYRAGSSGRTSGGYYRSYGGYGK